MAVENGQVIFFVTEELLCTHPYPILRGPRVYIFFFVSTISFSSVMATVANLKIKTALNTCRILKGQAVCVLSRPCVSL
jgi:hypothetical protein